MSIPEKAVISLPAFLPSIIATAVLSLALGYWVGVGNSFSSFGPSNRPRNKRKPIPDNGSSSSSDVSSEDEANLSQHSPSAFANEECKLVTIKFANRASH
jgi:hypothetical protein